MYGARALSHRERVREARVRIEMPETFRRLALTRPFFRLRAVALALRAATLSRWERALARRRLSVLTDLTTSAGDLICSNWITRTYSMLPYTTTAFRKSHLRKPPILQST